MARILLTDKGIKNLKPAKPGSRYDTWDSQVPGLTVRTTDKGAKTYQLVHRLPGQMRTRFSIAPVELGLAAAREIARKWLGLIVEGRDPRDVEKAELTARTTAKADAKDGKFPAVAEHYIATKLKSQINADQIVSIIRNEFIPPWRDLDVRAIETLTVTKVIEKKAMTAPGQARCMLNHIKQFFKWCVATGRVKYSPAMAVDAMQLLGPLVKRDRILTDDELARVWHVASQWPAPFGPIYLLLILTGCRLSEIADLHTREIDLGKRLIVIPKERMKGKPGKRKPHVIPLTDMMIAVLRPCIKAANNGYLFSKDGGVTPVRVLQETKNKMDKAAKVFTHWTNHDLRRTMRSHLETEEVGVAYQVAEEMIAHHKTGMNAVYNQYQYLKEKTAGFAAWNARVAQITGGRSKLRLVA